MKVRKYCLKVDRYEQGALIKALDTYAKKQEAAGEDNGDTISLLLKIADTKPKKSFF
jgi:hypothetical protein